MAAVVLAKRLRSRVEVAVVAAEFPWVEVLDQAGAQALAEVEASAAGEAAAAAVVSAAALLPAAARLRLPLPLAPLGFQRAGPNQ